MRVIYRRLRRIMQSSFHVLVVWIVRTLGTRGGLQRIGFKCDFRVVHS